MSSDPNERRAHFFYESKAEYPFAQAPNALTTQQIVEKTLSELPGPSLNPFNDDFLFMLNCPLTSRTNDEMREILAIYCCMFHLGSLVRYRPDVLEGMLSTRDSWIIERFTVSAPVTFLRHWRNLLDGEYLVYTAR